MQLHSANPAHFRTPFAKVFGNAERVRWPRAGGYGPFPGRLGHHACRYYDRRVRCSLDWDRRRRVTPARPRPRKHGLSCATGDVSPSGESRGGTPTGERAPSKAFSGNGGGTRDRARAAPAGAEVVKQRLSAFRFPLLSVAKGRKRNGPAIVGAEILKRLI